MQVHVARRVDSTPLPYSRVLLPVYEAVMNSIHSIEDSGQADGAIEIVLERDLTILSSDHHNFVPDLKNVVIVDNGVGFTPANQEAFTVVDTPHKEQRGGKGLGRLTWLKAFGRAEDDSVYFDEIGQPNRCQFSFERTPDGVEHLRCTPLPSAPRTTTVRLVGLKSDYQPHCPKRGDTIARRVVEHFFQNYLLGTMPTVTLRDESGGFPSIDLGSLYEAEYRPRKEPRIINVGSHTFSVQDVLLRDSVESDHSLHFCAANRPIRSITLTGKVPHLDSKIEDEDGNAVKYAAYVTGKLLEQKVNGERTDFSIDNRDELRFAGGIAWEDVVDAVTAHSADVLREHTSAARKRSLERITGFIRESAPEYRHLLKHATEELARISASEEKLELALHRVDAEWRARLKEEGEDILRKADASQEFAAREQQYQAFFERLNDAVKSDLAQYVVRRRMVLSFLEQQIEQGDDGKFPQEAVLHSLIMPQRVRSDEVTDDEQNLWILDERLAYHLFLASDMPFRDHDGPVEIASERRPDILLYNRAMMFSEGEDIISSAIIVEFKRPERNEYREDDNPVQQVYDYIDRVRAGKAKAVNGRTVRVSPELPFYCFIVADMTEKMRRFARLAGLTLAPERDGYSGYNGEYNAYVAVISYNKLLRDAKRRNKAFFTRLNMPTR